MNIDVYGMHYCGTCRATQKYLTSIDVPFTYHSLPPGEAGWRMVEEMSGRRATPCVLMDGRYVPFLKFKQWLESLGRTPRKLTQDELDAIE